MKDYYKILGVIEEASDEEIRARWIELMKHHHPDLGEGQMPDERIKEINEAYQVLKNESTRMEYDLERALRHSFVKRRKKKQRGRGLYVKMIPVAGAVVLLFIIVSLFLSNRSPEVIESTETAREYVPEEPGVEPKVLPREDLPESPSPAPEAVSKPPLETLPKQIPKPEVPLQARSPSREAPQKAPVKIAKTSPVGDSTLREVSRTDQVKPREVLPKQDERRETIPHVAPSILKPEAPKPSFVGDSTVREEPPPAVKPVPPVQVGSSTLREEKAESPRVHAAEKLQSPKPVGDSTLREAPSSLEKPIPLEPAKPEVQETAKIEAREIVKPKVHEPEKKVVREPERKVVQEPEKKVAQESPKPPVVAKPREPEIAAEAKPPIPAPTPVPKTGPLPKVEPAAPPPPRREEAKPTLIPEPPAKTKVAILPPARLHPPEEEVKQFFASYIDCYVRKDMEGFLSFFSSRAIQNRKDGMEGIRKIYTNFFNQSRELRYRLEELKIDVHKSGLEVKARYEVNQTLEKGGVKKVWKGQGRWFLEKEDGKFKIISLDYQHD
jgi:hypothetical protein